MNKLWEAGIRRHNKIMLLASVSSLSFYHLHEKTFLWIKGWDRDLCLQIPLLIKFKYAVNHFLCCRKKLRILQGKERKTHNQRSNNSSRNKSSKDRKTFFHDRDSSAKYDSKVIILYPVTQIILYPAPLQVPQVWQGEHRGEGQGWADPAREDRHREQPPALQVIILYPVTRIILYPVPPQLRRRPALPRAVRRARGEDRVSVLQVDAAVDKLSCQGSCHSCHAVTWSR